MLSWIKNSLKIVRNSLFDNKPVVSDNVLVPDRQQAITWTNDDPDAYIHHKASAS